MGEGRREMEGEEERWRERYREHKPGLCQTAFSAADKISSHEKGPLVLGGNYKKKKKIHVKICFFKILN